MVINPQQEQAAPYRLIGDPRVQLATGPVGTDAVQLLWELNDLIPYDGSRYRATTAVFTPHGQGEFLKDKNFEIHTSTDGQTFTQIAQVQGPTNTFLHKGLRSARLYYYKVHAFDSAGTLLAESPVTMAAAGPNLFREDSLQAYVKKKGMDGIVENPPLSIIQGTRPYAKTQPILRFQPSPSAKQVSFFGNLIHLSPDKTYLQGGWVRAPGNVWHGRYFYGPDKEGMSWGYSMPAVRNTLEWTFGVQLLLPDKDGTGSKRKDGKPFSMALKQWTFPTEAAYMSVFVTAFGPGQAGDFWIVELDPPPEAVPRP